jgi:hypothetical protein
VTPKDANQTRHISFQEIRNLQAEMPVHICTSEREGGRAGGGRAGGEASAAGNRSGVCRPRFHPPTSIPAGPHLNPAPYPPPPCPGFGHYINEARAAGAVVVTTDHPPMSELVTPAAGVLVEPERTASYPLMALRDYADINAFLGPRQICDGAARALAFRPGDAAARGALARADYLRDRREFIARVKELSAELARRGAGGKKGGGATGSDGAGDGGGSSREREGEGSSRGAVVGAAPAPKPRKRTAPGAAQTRDGAERSGSGGSGAAKRAAVEAARPRGRSGSSSRSSGGSSAKSDGSGAGSGGKQRGAAAAEAEVLRP